MIGAIPVQRNNGIDGFLKEYIDGKPVSVKNSKARWNIRWGSQQVNKGK